MRPPQRVEIIAVTVDGYPLDIAWCCASHISEFREEVWRRMGSSRRSGVEFLRPGVAHAADCRYCSREALEAALYAQLQVDMAAQRGV